MTEHVTEVLSKLKPHQETESGWTRGWRYCTYFWVVVRNVTYFWLVYLAFQRMNSTFEALVLAMLVLIYDRISDSWTLSARSTAEEGLLQRGLLLGLYKKFGDPEVQEAEEELGKLAKSFRKSDVPWFINVLGSFVVYVYVLWKLLSILVL
jgi:hypothetical protein